ncbi:MAG: alpha/beta fold hydrolase [Planctomycetes bacterium]|nr:alpha/beta fold hydrolase [Planctomycetota bacterium]
MNVNSLSDDPPPRRPAHPLAAVLLLLATGGAAVVVAVAGHVPAADAAILASPLAGVALVLLDGRIRLTRLMRRAAIRLPAAPLLVFAWSKTMPDSAGAPSAGEIALAAAFVAALGAGAFTYDHLLSLVTKRLFGFPPPPDRAPLVRRLFEGALRGALLVGTLLPLLFAVAQTHRLKLTTKAPPLPEFSAGCEEVRFETDDGLTLAGWFFPAKYRDTHRHSAVVVCHGLNANKENFHSHGLFLHQRLGCHVLVFDFRGHGESDGHLTTFGALERRDVAAAVDYLRSRPDVDPGRVFGLGFSMGASALLMAAAERPDLFRAIACDCPFGDLSAMARARVSGLPEWCRPLFLEALEPAARLYLGGPVSSVSPRREAEGLTTPLLLIHGDADSVIPCEETLRIHAAAPKGAGLMVVHGAGHAGSHAQNALEYERRVLDHFRRNDRLP